MPSKSIVGLSGPFSRIELADCPRCKAQGDASWPWPHWRHLRNFWFSAVAAIVVASPIVMSDVYWLLPLCLTFVLALGPLISLARVRPTCLRCGCVVEAPQRKAS
jgi:hypothetical protein